MIDAPLEDQLGADEADLLRSALAALAEGASEALGEGLIGVYLTGSFALGAGDVHADVDFLVVTATDLSETEQRSVRALHASLPDRTEHWAHHLEGSYAALPGLRRRASPAEPWLYVDNGNREMEWSTHDNTEVFRWVVRNRALTISGPAAATLLDAVPEQALRDEVVADAVSRRQDLLDDPDYLRNAWGQPHEVLTRCRMLYTATTGEVTGKADAAGWCLGVLAAEWHDLLDRAVADRPDPWGRAHRSGDPALAERTREFVDHVTTLVRAAQQPTTQADSHTQS